jgi:hypothetical protein
MQVIYAAPRPGGLLVAARWMGMIGPTPELVRA